MVLESMPKANVWDLTRKYKEHYLKNLYYDFHFFYEAFGIKGIELKQRIYLTTTAPHFGGKKLWFICPNCRRKSYVLYLYVPNNVMICSRCHPKKYELETVSKSRYKTVSLEKKIARYEQIMDKCKYSSRKFFKYFTLKDKAEKELIMIFHTRAEKIKESFERLKMDINKNKK